MALNVLNEELSQDDHQSKDEARVGTNNSKQILIVSTWRSGSSFFGQLLQSYPGVFYLYEPMHGMVDDGSNYQKREFLTKVLHCNFQDQQLKTFIEKKKEKRFGSFTLDNRSLRFMNICRSVSKSMCYDSVFWSQVCPIFKIRLIKSVIIHVAATRELLQDPQLNLQIILLVRDPRCLPFKI